MLEGFAAVGCSCRPVILSHDYDECHLCHSLSYKQDK